jgi:very-short-patch-repair endonuclease
VALLAASQLGLVTRAQLRELGLSERSVGGRLTSGRLVALYPGVYGITGAPHSWEQGVLAACLRTSGVASHRTAAALLRLSKAGPGELEVTTARQVRPRGVRVYRSVLGTEETTRVGPIPVTGAARTLLDLGGVADRSAVESALSEALRQRLVSLPRLTAYLKRVGGRGRRGAELLRSVLESLDGRPTESILEQKLFRVLRRYGLPLPVSQFRIHRGDQVVARVDFAYPERGLAIEADGYLFHSDPVSWRKDRARRNALTGMGWYVVHVTWADLNERPDLVARRIREALEVTRPSLLGKAR